MVKVNNLYMVLIPSKHSERNRYNRGMDISAYDDFSRDYDRFVNWESRLAAEMPFLEKLLGRIKKNTDAPLALLDAASGTGMHAIELALRGYRAAGADLSPRMVDAARKNARGAGVDVLFRTAGFMQLQSAFKGEKGFPFDALTCFGNSLPHLTSRANLKAAIKDFAACLRPGGMLILQNRNFDAVMARRKRWITPQSRHVGNREWLFLRFYDFDPDGLITFNILRLYREGKKSWTQTASVVRLYPLLQDELMDLLQESGFGEARAFGLMDDAPFDPATSENLVVAAIRQ